ncbi:hypothetical protein [Endozoicomonas sp. ALC066]|uniref:hypothetical protein n=1 Tax=Endozoicomonas sp. ALC066 TaxID=3403078 RepID=UPI003BB7E0C6
MKDGKLVFEATYQTTLWVHTDFIICGDRFEAEMYADKECRSHGAELTHLIPVRRRDIKVGKNYSTVELT